MNNDDPQKLMSDPAIITTTENYLANQDKYLDCAVCSWRGTVAEADNEAMDVLFEVRCPKCEKILLIAS